MLHYNALPAAAKIDTWRLYKTPSALAFPSAKKSSKTTILSPFFGYLKISDIHGVPNILLTHGPSLLSVSLIFTANKFPVSHFCLSNLKPSHTKHESVGQLQIHRKVFPHNESFYSGIVSTRSALSQTAAALSGTSACWGRFPALSACPRLHKAGHAQQACLPHTISLNWEPSALCLAAPP